MSKPFQTGRIIKIVNLANACFYELLTYDNSEHQFKIIKCVLERELLGDQYESILNYLFLGSVIGITEADIKEDKLGNPLYSTRALICYNDRTTEIYSPYPNRFKLNELKDKETIYKDRGFAFTVRTDLINNLAKKYALLQQFRSTFIREQFISVPTPVLQNYSGGAEADPFETKCNYNKKMYTLRTCLEFPLKGLLIAGFPKVFHIGSAFRNESLDTTHSPEFLFCEAYAINQNLDYFRALTEKIYAEAYYSANKTYFKHGFDVSKPWPVYTKEYLQQKIKEQKLQDLDALIDTKILGPFYHIKGYESILAKTPEARIQSYCDYTVELCNYYEEENSCKALTDKSERSPVKVAPEFLNLLSYGMPSAAGWGIGLDRLIMSCLNVPNIRDTQEYPLY